MAETDKTAVQKIEEVRDALTIFAMMAQSNPKGAERLGLMVKMLTEALAELSVAHPES